MDRLVALLVRLVATFSGRGSCVSRLLAPAFDSWREGRRLKLLLVGYNGARNTGSDARVVEMVRQFGAVLGPENIEISVLALDRDGFSRYFDSDVRVIEFSPVFFIDLLRACSTHHMAVLCEGSTLKSKFANALTLAFCMAAGVMRRQGKPCIAYGSEAGDMDPFVARTARALCGGTHFISRSASSVAITRGLGLKSHLGTDTAWTFRPAPAAWARAALERTGWDGRSPLLGLAPIDPFCWPVRPSITRFMRSLLTGDWEEQYRQLYFFSSSPDRRRRLDAYIGSIASAAADFARANGAHVVVVGMEALDTRVCERLASLVPGNVAVFSAIDHDAQQMAAVLRSLSLLVTSRYHARVLSIPTGVPAIAISMDERLRNIYRELGQFEDYCLDTDAAGLDRRLRPALDAMWRDRESISRRTKDAHEHYLRTMGGMGIFFHDYVRRSFPGIRLRPRPESWAAALPENDVASTKTGPSLRTRGRSRGPSGGRRAPVNVTALGECCQCGMCESMCDNVRLGPGRGLNQDFSPAVEDPSRCEICRAKRCLRSCPLADTREARARWQVPAPRSESDPGPIRGIIIGHSRHADLRERAASGGVVSSLGRFMLTSGAATGVVAVVRDEADPLGGRFVTIEDPELLAGSCSSIYGVVPLGRALADLRRNPDGRRLVFIGRPCQIRALNRAASAMPGIAGAIALKVSLFCAWSVSRRGIEFLAGLLGITDMSSIRSVEFRHGQWPGTLRFETVDGPVQWGSSTRSHTCGTHYYPCLTPFVPDQCRRCFDVLGAEADISAGDPWNLGLKAADGHGYTLVVARTALGQRLLETEALNRDFISADRRMTREQLDVSQGNTVRMKRAGILSGGRPRPGESRDLKAYRLLDRAYSWCVGRLPRGLPRRAFVGAYLEFFWRMLAMGHDREQYVQAPRGTPGPHSVDGKSG